MVENSVACVPLADQVSGQRTGCAARHVFAREHGTGVGGRHTGPAPGKTVVHTEFTRDGK